MKLFGAKVLNSFSIKFSVMATAIIKLMGGMTVHLEVLIYLTIIDYISGLLKAVYTKKLSSEIGYRGIIKKVFMFVIVIVAYQVERVTGLEESISLMVILFYIANESISILENASSIEVLPIPQRLKDILIQLRGE